MTAETSDYIRHTEAFPRLSREDEHTLAVSAAHGDAAARERLVAANLRYVVPIALGYRRYGVRLGDLISEGNVGLMIAVDKFDAERGTRFVTYAAHWIRAMMLDHVIKTWSLVGMGAGPLRSKVFFRLRRERAKLIAETHDPDLAIRTLADRYGTTPERLALLAQRLDARDISVDAPAHDDGTATVLDTIASPIASQEDVFLAKERSLALGARVREAVANLDPRERFIVLSRVMADEPDELSLAELGRKLGVSRERARQIEARAKAKLKKSLEAWHASVDVAA